jgi:DNA-binding response OmpR family regulator
MPSLLVVDDEPNILLAFRRAYRDAGLEVLTADTAEDGLALAAAHRPDVVVLDVQLPDLNGLEVFRRLHALDAHTPVISSPARAPPTRPSRP